MNRRKRAEREHRERLRLDFFAAARDRVLAMSPERKEFARSMADALGSGVVAELGDEVTADIGALFLCGAMRSEFYYDCVGNVLGFDVVMNVEGELHPVSVGQVPPAALAAWRNRMGGDHG